jgi:hypothetical protein
MSPITDHTFLTLHAQHYHSDSITKVLGNDTGTPPQDDAPIHASLCNSTIPKRPNLDRLCDLNNIHNYCCNSGLVLS